MGSSSDDDDSEISESDIASYKEKTYEELKTGKYKVKLSNDIYRCPFCLGKKKQHHDFKALMQHASGVGKGSANRRAKDKANHLALAKYMEIYRTNKPDLSLEKTNEPGPPVSIAEVEPVTKPLEHNDEYVWPWTGIIVNIQSKPRDDDASYIKKEFSRFRPVEVQTLWNKNDGIGYAILDFNRDWVGFNNANAFEKEYENKHHDKKYWNKRRKDPGSRRYGWFARAEDYHSEGMIGDYLRNNGQLKTISDIVDEALQKKQNIVENLTSEIDAKNDDLTEWQNKFNVTSMSIEKLMDDKQKLEHTYNEEIRKLQRTGRERTKRILHESEQMKHDLDARRKDMEHWSNQLNKKEAVNERERKKLDEEMNKSLAKNNSLNMASMEQKKSDEKVLRLIEDQKREKEGALHKILQLEKKLDAKQKLELEIQEMKGNLQVMKHMGGEDDQKLKEKMESIDEELKDKMEEMEDLEELNQTLLIKERKCNDELQEAREELIEGLTHIMRYRSTIGIKRMGELDDKPFQEACKQIFPARDAPIKAGELCFLWQEHLRSPEWHPFKIVVEGENHKEIMDEEDEKLVSARRELGDEVCEAIITALKEMKEYTPSGRRCVVPELWNFKEERKATLKEVVAYILRSIKANKKRKK